MTLKARCHDSFKIGIDTFRRKNEKKSNHHYTRGITPKRVTSGGVHLFSLAHGQHSYEETTQMWRAVGDTLSDLTGLGIEAQTFRTDSDVLDN